MKPPPPNNKKITKSVKSPCWLFGRFIHSCSFHQYGYQIQPWTAQRGRYCRQGDSAVDTTTACLTFSTASLLRKRRNCYTGFFIKKRSLPKWAQMTSPPTRSEIVSRERVGRDPSFTPPLVLCDYATAAYNRDGAMTEMCLFMFRHGGSSNHLQSKYQIFKFFFLISFFHFHIILFFFCI